MTQGLDDSTTRPGVALPSGESGPGAPRREGRWTLRNVGRAGLAPALAVGFALVLLAWLWPPVHAAGAQSASGQDLFAQHCASCHQAGGQGIEGTFPPLAGNPAASDEAYVELVIRDGLSGPIEVLGVGYDAIMPPAVGLTDPADIQQIVSYVAELAGSSTAGQNGTDQDGTGQGDAPSEAATESGTASDTGSDDGDEEVAAGPIVGDVDRGHDLFLGAARFDQGGPACAACHTAGSIGNLGGSGLGPDLTDSLQALGGEAGLSGWLANPPSPVMQPLFADQPLNESELADVVAFLGDTPQQEKPASNYDRLTVAGFVGLVVLIAGMALAWRGMRQTYVERLRRRPGGRRRGIAQPGSGLDRGPGSTAAPNPRRRERTVQAGGRSQ